MSLYRLMVNLIICSNNSVASPLKFGILRIARDYDYD